MPLGPATRRSPNWPPRVRYRTYVCTVSKPQVIRQAYRFALAPTREQEEFLSSCCGASRFWFNQGLALVKDRLDRRSVGEKVHVPWSYTSLCSEFAPHKDEVCPWRSEVVVGSMQAGLEQLGRALQQFSRGRRTGRRVGFPTFRVKGRCHESVIFQRPRLADSRHVVLDQRLGRLRTKESIRKMARLLETMSTRACSAQPSSARRAAGLSASLSSALLSCAALADVTRLSGLIWAWRDWRRSRLDRPCRTRGR